MTLSPEQLEAVVREVIRRLDEMQSPNGTPAEDLSIDDRLITTHTLEGRLAGVGRLVVGARAIVTPAAMDLLREKNVKLIR